MKVFSLMSLHQVFMARNSRERWLLLCSGWALLAWLGLVLFESTLLANKQQLLAENEQLRRAIVERSQQSAELTTLISSLSVEAHERKIAQLKQRLARLNENVEGRLQSLVGPEQMAELLLDVLAQENGLRLQQLQNKPAQGITTPTGDTLYRHGISLQLSGSFTQLLDYVRRLESLQGRLYWQSLDFELEQYPDARIRLDFFTLSEYKELLRG